MARRKKARSPGGFGPRYGTKIRKLAVEIERKVKRKYKCQSCGAQRVKRVNTAIWQCGRCGVKFAGAAYSPSVFAAPVESSTRRKE